MQNIASLVDVIKVRTLFYSIVFVCIGVLAHCAANHSPVALSLGGAGVAGMDPVEGSYLNPAAIANAEKNYMVLSFAEGQVNSKDLNNIHFTALDSGRASITQGAIVYSKREESSDTTRKTISRWELSAAKYSKAGMTYGLSFTKEILRDHENQLEYVDYNLDFGGIYNHSPRWSFGFLFTDIITGKEGRQSRNTKIGINHRTDRWFSYFLDFGYQDQNNPNDDRVTSMGLQINTTSEVYWRLGYKADDSLGNFYSLGFSWVGPRLGIHYAFQSHTKISAESLHILDLRVFF